MKSHLPRLFSIVLLFVTSISSLAEGALRTVAHTGQSAPGTTGTFSDLYFTGGNPEPPVLNGAGQVAFTATLTSGVGGVTAPDDTGLWAESNGSLALVGREGSTAPGGPAGALYRRLDSPALNNDGRIAFHGLLREGVAGVTVDSNEAIWSNGAGSFSVVAREGNAAPGTPAGVLFNTLLNPTFNNAGQAAFRATLRGTGVTAANDKGVWAQKGGTLALVARTGEQAPGAPAGVNFNNFGNSLPSIGSANQVGLKAFLTGAGVTTANDAGVWVERGGALSMVAREGNQAPGVEPGTVFGIITDPTINRHGQMVFAATLTGGPNSGNGGVWAESNNTLSLLVRKGNQAVGAPAGSIFANFASPIINGKGDVAFQATLSGAPISANNDQGVWAYRDGAMSKLVREGDSAPGAGNGVVFSAFDDLAFNNMGQAAFLGTLTGPDVTAQNDKGIWASTPGGELRLIAREGQTVEISPGQSRVIASLYFAGDSSNEAGQRSGFNDRGELAFLAVFSNIPGNGIFVSDVVKLASGDFDGNQIVDGADFLRWQRGFGITSNATRSDGDADGDGDVDAADLAAWKSSFPIPSAQALAAPVPEPAMGLLSALTAAAVVSLGRSCMRRRRSMAMKIQ